MGSMVSAVPDPDPNPNLNPNQALVMSRICRNMLLVYCFSMQLGPVTMRNVSPGLKPPCHSPSTRR
jgi:hypothetical protein